MSGIEEWLGDTTDVLHEIHLENKFFFNAQV